MINKICTAIIAVIILTLSTSIANTAALELQWKFYEYSYSRH